MRGWLSCADKGSFLDDFFSKTADMAPQERGTYLENPPQGAPDIDKAHEVPVGWCTSKAPMGLNCDRNIRRQNAI